LTRWLFGAPVVPSAIAGWKYFTSGSVIAGELVK
jgi:hypothetical protein